MAISKEQFKYEKEYLKETQDWIRNRIIKLQKEEDEIEKNISKLRKETKGKYNSELDILLRSSESTKETIGSYGEASVNTYFARIDFREKLRNAESFYIGKVGVDNIEEGEEIVIDWRAPIADLYYSGTEGVCSYKAPIGNVDGELTLKRKFIIKDGVLEDAFDEGINEIILKGKEKGEENELIDEFLKVNLESSASKKLKDIVATIQKEQNEIIRADKGKSIIVQGSAGSGKTTVALHRLAYLLYKYKDTMGGEDVLVIAPNKLFLDYISDVLPDLGVDRVMQKTYEDLALEILKFKKFKFYSKDEKLSKVIELKDDDEVKFITNASKLKGSIVFKNILDRYLKYIEIMGIDFEDICVGEYIIYSKKEIKRLFSNDLKHLAIGNRIKEIQRYFRAKLKKTILKVQEGIEFKCDLKIKEIKSTMENSEERREELIKVYNKRDEDKEMIKKEARNALKEYFKGFGLGSILDLYIELFEDEDLLSIVTSDKLPSKLIDYIKEDLKENISKKILDVDDLAALLYLKLNIEGVDALYEHIVVDEAQDYSPFQIEVLKGLSANKSFTIVGDTGQSIYYYKGIDDWNKVVDGVFSDDIEYIPLSQSYRSTVEIVDFANKVLERQKNSLKPAKPVLRHGDKPKLIEFNKDEDVINNIEDVINDLLNKGKNTLAIVGKDKEECKKINKILKKSKFDFELIKDSNSNFNSNYMIIPSYMTKGLEFDCVVIYNCSKENYKDTELDKRLLYVALTRALHIEYVMYSGEISQLIV